MQAGSILRRELRNTWKLFACGNKFLKIQRFIYIQLKFSPCLRCRQRAYGKTGLDEVYQLFKEGLIEWSGGRCAICRI